MTAETLSAEEFLAEATRPEYRRVATARILLRQDLIKRHEQLEADLQRAVADDAKHNRSPQAPAIAEQLVELEAEIEEAKREVVFGAIGRKRWADLQKEHPPKKEQIKEHGNLPFNPETFPNAAMAESSVSPRFSLEDIETLERVLTQTDYDLMWAKCCEANIGGGASPKSVAAGRILQLRDEFASSAAITEYPAPSSWDE